MKRSFPAHLAALTAILGLSLAACGSSKSAYPALRDIPPPPKELTPEAVRESLKADLDKERTDEVAPPAPVEGNKGRREPAVPPKRPKGQSSALEGESVLQGAECASPPPERPLRLVGAIPPLRGTLRGSGRLEPEGVTAATGARTPGPALLQFEPGTADLSATNLEGLRLRAASFLAQAGGSVLVDVRGTPPATPNAVRSLDGFQLGLRRASVIANYLIAQGIGSERIKLLVTDADGKASPVGGVDGATVTFVSGASP